MSSLYIGHAYSYYFVIFNFHANIYTLARQKYCARIQAMPTPYYMYKKYEILKLLVSFCRFVFTNSENENIYQKRRRSIIDIGYGSYFNSFTGEQKHKKSSLFVGLKVYSQAEKFLRLVRIKQKFIRIAYLYSKCTDCRIKLVITLIEQQCCSLRDCMCCFYSKHTTL